MPVIKFSHNWNGKLDNNIFTTIRRATPRKTDYYIGHHGDVFDVHLNKLSYCDSKLIEVAIMPLSEINHSLLMLDTGCQEYLEIFQKFGVYVDTEVLLLTYKKLED